MALRFTSDPRVRQRFNQISENLESANERTKTSIFTFSESYIRPCLESLQPCLVSFQTCLEASCQPCCAVRDDIRRHRQPRYARRGRERAAFDFYDDWDEQEEEWGNDEMNRLLAGDETQQPSRRQGMNYGYGTRGAQRRTTAGKDPLADDPTLVPQSSIFGFLERLPWKIGGRGTRYRPSPANLRINVGKRGQEAEALLEDEEAEGVRGKKRRPRSSTVGSRETANSLSSRGDIFPSDDEDDAREIDDEFALALGRRNTGATSDDLSSKRRKGNSRTSTKSASSKESRSTDKEDRARSVSSERRALSASPVDEIIPSLDDLKREEHEVQIAEEQEVEHRRIAAVQLASQLGLSQSASPDDDDPNDLSGTEPRDIASPSREGQELPHGNGTSTSQDTPSVDDTDDVVYDSSNSKPA